MSVNGPDARKGLLANMIASEFLFLLIRCPVSYKAVTLIGDIRPYTPPSLSPMFVAVARKLLVVWML